ncbi:MAG: hypothetical protein ACKOFH_10550 [Chthoniobacterales bacterium]
MKVFADYRGRSVRLTPERADHILGHPEMVDLLERVEDTLAKPERVVLSASDASVELFYTFERETKVGDKWLCVVVKYVLDDAFVVTAYLTDKVKKGEHLWPRK